MARVAWDPIALVAMYKNPPSGHAPKQRTPLALAVCITLRSRFDSSTGTVKAFLAWMLLFATACLRFAHLQRSTGLRCEGHILAAFCKMFFNSLLHGAHRRVLGRMFVLHPHCCWSTGSCVWPSQILPLLFLICSCKSLVGWSPGRRSWLRR